MENWKAAWRAIAPGIETERLKLLCDGLECDDPSLIQGRTSDENGNACAIGYCSGSENPTEIEEYFERVWFAAAKKMTVPKLTHFTEWFDEGERADVFAKLLAETRLILDERVGE